MKPKDDTEPHPRYGYVRDFFGEITAQTSTGTATASVHGGTDNLLFGGVTMDSEDEAEERAILMAGCLEGCLPPMIALVIVIIAAGCLLF